jgi:hypothetical protein
MGIPRASTSSISPYAEMSAEITAASIPTEPCEGPTEITRSSPPRQAKEIEVMGAIGI